MICTCPREGKDRVCGDRIQIVVFLKGEAWLLKHDAEHPQGYIAIPTDFTHCPYCGGMLTESEVRRDG